MKLFLLDIKMDLGFLLDTNSGNFRPDHYVNVLNSVKSTYAPFVISKDKTRVGIVTYGSRTRVAISLDQYTTRQSLDTAVDQILISPGSNVLGQGLVAAKMQLFQGNNRPKTPKVLIVFAGGKSIDDVARPSAELKELNTTIFCVGVGDNVDRKQLNSIATSPSTNHVMAASISHRETAGENLASRIKRGRYFS